MKRGAGRKIVQNAIFRGKRHDNKILKVQILLSRNFVVMAQAPRGQEGCKGVVNRSPAPPEKVGRRVFNRRFVAGLHIPMTEIL